MHRIRHPALDLELAGLLSRKDLWGQEMRNTRTPPRDSARGGVRSKVGKPLNYMINRLTFLTECYISVRMVNLWHVRDFMAQALQQA
jgi:hypothetical protein